MRTKLTLEESMDLLAEEIKLARTAKDYHFVAYLKDIVRELNVDYIMKELDVKYPDAEYEK